MMQLTTEQLARLRQPLEEVGAFEGMPEEEIIKVVTEYAEIYTALAQINLNSKK